MKKLLVNISLFIFISFCFSCKSENYKWVSIGDSITWQDGKKYQKGENKGEVAIGYQTLIITSMDTSVSLLNKGASGLPLTSGSDRGSIIINSLSESFKGFDMVTIAVGTNDFKLNKEIGDFNKNPQTFSGAFQLLIEHIRKDNDRCKIILFTPLHRNNDTYTSYSVNKAGYKLEDYIGVINKISGMYNLQVVDMFNESGIDEATLNEYTIDGLHPNDSGYKKMAELFLKTVDIPKKKNY